MCYTRLFSDGPTPGVGPSPYTLLVGLSDIDQLSRFSRQPNADMAGKSYPWSSKPPPSSRLANPKLLKYYLACWLRKHRVKQRSTGINGVLFEQTTSFRILQRMPDFLQSGHLYGPTNSPETGRPSCSSIERFATLYRSPQAPLGAAP
jgi:hypothetical protein